MVNTFCFLSVTSITMRKFFSAILLTFCLALYSAGPYYTCPWRGNIRTLQVRNTSSRILERPMLVLGSGEQLEISFDELSHNGHNYSYTIEHCNADWTPSDLFSGEYLQGFTTADITDYLTSLNTSVNYTHYRFLIPNEDMQLLRSGNYCVRIYEDNDPENRTIATACFSVVDPHIDISANIRSQTDIELNNRYQQLDISLNTRSYPMRDPMSELTVVVRQNGRLDNQVVIRKPNYIGPGLIRYDHTRELIFEGGNEFRRFDIPSLHLLGTGVEDFEYYDGNYHALLYPAYNRARLPFNEDNDAHGQMIINAERTTDVDTEAEYVFVHMFMPCDVPYLDGDIYVCGDLTYNLMLPANRMTYDNQQKGYMYSGMYKQGGYDFELLFLQRGTNEGTTLRTEGSHWQTSNEYAIYVYHRPFGERYDRLVGYSVIR